MTKARTTDPRQVVDRLLWHDAQVMLDRHTGPDADGWCVWCGRSWPCAARRLAERAEAAAFKSWNEAWTVRHDLYGLRAAPGWLIDRPRSVARNRGPFD